MNLIVQHYTMPPKYSGLSKGPPGSPLIVGKSIFQHYPRLSKHSGFSKRSEGNPVACLLTSCCYMNKLYFPPYKLF